LFSDGRQLLFVFDTKPTKLFKEPINGDYPYTLKSTVEITYTVYTSTATDPEDFEFHSTHTDNIDYAFTSIVYSTEVIYESSTGTLIFFDPITALPNFKAPINFGTVDLPSFVKVSGIEYSVLPPITHKAINFSGRAGAYDYGVDLGQSKIKVSIQIIADDEFDIIKKTRLLADWLYHEDLQPLLLEDEPDKQYMARVIGETNIAELVRVGQGTLEFTCPNAYAEGLADVNYNFSPTDITPMQIENVGTVEAYPVIELTVKEDTSSLTLISDKKFITVGQSQTITKPTAVKDPEILGINGYAYSGWSNGVAVEGGTITGSFASNGFTFSPGYGGGSYGTGSTWHGPAGIKSLSKELQDFRVSTIFGHWSTAPDQIGRLEISLLDVNNQVIGKLGLLDVSNTETMSVFEARAGTMSAGYNFVNNTVGSYRGSLNDIYGGLMYIGRKGLTWYAYITKMDENGNHYNSYYKEWVDVKNNYTSNVNRKLAKIQVHIGTYGEYSPVNLMYFSSISIQELTDVDVTTNTPIYFRTGDKVTIDNDKAIVLHNGAPAFHLLDPSSEFIRLKSGNNDIILSPPKADVSVTFRERWL
jgi:predicted phage tail component-like protein